MSNSKSTQDLVGQIELKDKRFRISQWVFMIATLIALSIVMTSQLRTLSGIKAQAAKAASQSDDQRDKIIRRLDCIVVFFSQPDRTHLTIKDIDKCALNRNKDIEQFFAKPESTPSEKPPNLTVSGSRPTSPAAQQPQQNNTGGSGGSDPTYPTTPETPPFIAPKVLKVITQPICDATTVCVLDNSAIIKP